MKFLILTQYFPPEVGAAQTRLAALSRELISAGHEVEVVTAFPNYPDGKIQPGYSGFYRKENWEGIVIHRFWLIAAQGKALARLLNYLSFALTSMFGVFVVRRPDWIFVNSGPLFLAAPGRLFSLRFSAPVIFNVSDLWPRSVQHLGGSGARLFSFFALSLERWAYAKATFINAITEGVRETLLAEKKIASQKVLFLPNGVDTRRFVPGIAPAGLCEKLGVGGRFVLIYPGNHGYAHALHRVLEAASLLREREVKASFLFVGGGSEKSNLQAEAKKRNLDNVIFHDPVSPQELAHLIDLADVGLVHVRNSPLANETRPAKLFPIMAQAKPVLFAGFGEGAELVKASAGGIVIPPEDPEKLAAAVETMMSAPLKLIQWGNNNRKYVEQNFDTRGIVQEWLRCLE